jgi:hypothetical protein
MRRDYSCSSQICVTQLLVYQVLRKTKNRYMCFRGNASDVFLRSTISFWREGRDASLGTLFMTVNNYQFHESSICDCAFSLLSSSLLSQNPSIPTCASDITKKPPLQIVVLHTVEPPICRSSLLGRFQYVAHQPSSLVLEALCFDLRILIFDIPSFSTTTYLCSQNAHGPSLDPHPSTTSHTSTAERTNLPHASPQPIPIALSRAISAFPILLSTKKHATPPLPSSPVWFSTCHFSTTWCLLRIQSTPSRRHPCKLPAATYLHSLAQIEVYVRCELGPLECSVH